MGKMLDRKGITSFLLITFGLTYLIEGGLILAGFRVSRIPPLYGQFVILGVMWVPAIAAVLTVKRVTGEGFRVTNLRLGSVKPYFTSALVIPGCFIIIYTLTWLLGLGQPDWRLENFRSLLTASGADLSAMPSPSLVLLLIFLSSLLVSPFFNGIFGFGEELGWRGYLLPKLMPLGKFRAYLIVGVVWGLWHAPLVAVGFNYPGHPFPGIIMMTAMTTTLGIYINELSLRNRSSVLAGWMHGVVNGQVYGVWRILFPGVNPLLGGFTGLVGIAVWLALGLWEAHRSCVTGIPAGQNMALQ